MTQVGRERGKRQTETIPGSGMYGSRDWEHWAVCWRNCSTPETQCLLERVEQRAGVIAHD